MASSGGANAYDNKIHVSEIYGNSTRDSMNFRFVDMFLSCLDADDGLVPSDNPTTSTYFGSILCSYF